MYQIQELHDKTIIIKLVENEMFIPVDENNADYQEYLEWIAQGSKPVNLDKNIGV